MRGKARVEAFSDGVLAIVITLLALDLHVEASGDLVQQLGERWPNFALSPCPSSSPA